MRFPGVLVCQIGIQSGKTIARGLAILLFIIFAR